MINNNLGWDAGARSVQTQSGDCVASFAPTPNSVGVIVGFNTINRDAGVADIKYGIYFRKAAGVQLFSAIEAGAQVGASGTYTAADKFQITRNTSVVQYWKNGVVFYTSAVLSTGIVFLDTSLYAAGDGVQ